MFFLLCLIDYCFRIKFLNMSKSNNLGVEKIGNLKTKLNVEHSFEIKKFKNSSFQLSTEEPLHENSKKFKNQIKKKLFL